MRFPNFSKSWNKSELKTFANRINRRNSNNESSLPLTISAQLGLINQNDFFNKQIASRDLSNYILIKNGEFAYNKSYSADYPWGAIKRLDLYEKGALSSLYICFSLIDNAVSDYFVHYFESSKWHKQISDIAGEGARNHGLLNMSVSDFFETVHKFPTQEEQVKISNFLNLINERILTQSKIIEDLETLKNGIWDDVYKKESLNWNEVKLKNILTERKTYCVKDSTYPHATLSKEGISLKTDRYNRDFLVKDDEKNYKVTHLNDICYNPANLKIGVICRNKLGSAIFSPIYITYEVNSNFNAAFIEYILTNSSFINYIRKYEQGTVYERMAVNSEDFLKGIIKLPPLDIQTKIINLMHSFELKIQKEKDMLELYKKQKAYLLQNMFI